MLGIDIGEAYGAKDGAAVGPSMPNYYSVLAIETFEEDTSVIEWAAEQQEMETHARYAARPGGAPLHVLALIAAAKTCLLEPRRKAAYDAQLWCHLQTVPPAAVEPPALDEKDQELAWEHLMEEVIGQPATRAHER